MSLPSIDKVCYHVPLNMWNNENGHYFPYNSIFPSGRQKRPSNLQMGEETSLDRSGFELTSFILFFRPAPNLLFLVSVNRIYFLR